MSKDNQTPAVEVPTSTNAKRVDDGQVHPVLAEIISEKEPDTVSWVKA